MGRLFTYDEIESGKIPTPELFEVASDIYSEMIDIYRERKIIDGAFIFGSVAIGRQNHRSDFDGKIALLRSDDIGQDAVKNIIQNIHNVCNDTVPTQIKAFSVESLKDGSHGAERLFGQHMVSKDRIVIGNDIAEYITFDTATPVKTLFTNYLRRKNKCLESARLSDKPLDIRDGNLQQMLELPIAVGRKAICGLIDTGRYPQSIGSGSNKQLVAEKSQELFHQYDINKGFDELIQLNEQYDRILDDTINGKVDRATYEEFIRDIHSSLPQAIKWLQQVESVTLPLFDNPNK